VASLAGLADFAKLRFDGRHVATFGYVSQGFGFNLEGEVYSKNWTHP
jgi:hypothetical protein